MPNEAITIQAWIDLLMGDEASWPNDLPNIGLSDFAYEWAKQHAAIHFPNEDFYVAEKWLRCYRFCPLPIGRNAIETYSYLQHGIDRHGKEQMPRLALLPGDEYLYAPLSYTINNTICELLFLAHLVDQNEHEVTAVIPSTENPYSIPGSTISFPEWDSWGAKDVAFRIMGYPDDPDVQALVKRAREWWAGFNNKPLPRGGRPRIDLDYETAAKHWHNLHDGYEASHIKERKPRVSDFLEYLQQEEGVSVSKRSFSYLKAEWRKEGHKWPPSI